MANRKMWKKKCLLWLGTNKQINAINTDEVDSGTGRKMLMGRGGEGAVWRDSWRDEPFRSCAGGGSANAGNPRKKEDAHFEGTTFARVSHPVVLTEAIVSSCIRNVYRIVSPGGESFFILTVIVLLFSAGKWQLEWIIFSRPPGCWSSTPLVLSQRGCSPSRPDKVARPTSTYTLSHTSSSQLPSHPASVKSKKNKQQTKTTTWTQSWRLLKHPLAIFNNYFFYWWEKWFNYLWP